MEGKVLWISATVDVERVHSAVKGMVTGLARVARAESASTTVQYLDVHDAIGTDKDALINSITGLVSARIQDTPYLARGIEPEYVYRNGLLWIPRLQPSKSFEMFISPHREHVVAATFGQGGKPSKLHIETPGLLDTMIFVEDVAVKSTLDPNEIEINTKAFGINFKDVYIALGQMKHSDHLVGECAGIITKVGDNLHDIYKVGDRVCAWRATAFASHARVSGSCAYILPEDLSFAEGASVPIVYMTAYWGLVQKANLQKGQSVLIHAAAGGVGQAAIQLAQHIGAEIFVTVGSASKRDMVNRQFGIPESHIFSTRVRSFKDGILRLTGGRGVDVVLNSLSGESLTDSWACIARHGTFLEIGKNDIYANGQLNMSPFSKSTTFSAYDLSILTEDFAWDLRSILGKCMDLLRQGAIKPPNPIITMSIGEIEDAFRLIQARKHSGKVVLIAESTSLVKSLSVPPPFVFDSEGAFVIAGGLGDLGRKITLFLARHGAKHIVALGRNALDEEASRHFKEAVNAFGAHSHHIICDITVRYFYNTIIFTNTL